MSLSSATAAQLETLDGVGPALAARIITLTMYRNEQYMLDAIRAGARGYLLKTVDAGELITAIKAVHRGDYLIDPTVAARVLSELHMSVPDLPYVEPLTEGEMIVLRLVATGTENREIAQKLNYSVYTVSNRLRTIYEKLHVSNRTQAALYALRQGWVSLDEPSTQARRPRSRFLAPCVHHPHNKSM